MLDARAREALEGFSNWTGRTLSRLGLTANMITAFGVVLSGVAAWRMAEGAFLAGGLIMTAGGCLDFCDGAVARVRGTASRFGAFLDSVTDRFSDAFVFSGLGWYYFRKSDEWLFAIVLAGYGAAVLTSYIRAKAESLGYDCKVGLLERAERLIVINAGLILSTFASSLIEIALLIVAVLGIVTVVQRLVYVSRQGRTES
ncbi:MAG TPA: CDP-alcohol phosphatidyltransferase family protein [Actinomycetota bacterium]|nr:CDP-alcohol phosphatidyltransferase family protein [Actinomycetota bacterium]